MGEATKFQFGDGVRTKGNTEGIIIESFPDGVAILDERGHLVHCDPRVVEFYPEAPVPPALAAKDAEIARLRERVEVAEREMAWAYGVQIPEASEAARREALEEAAKHYDNKAIELWQCIRDTSSMPDRTKLRRAVDRCEETAAELRALIAPKPDASDEDPDPFEGFRIGDKVCRRKGGGIGAIIVLNGERRIASVATARTVYIADFDNLVRIADASEPSTGKDA